MVNHIYNVHFDDKGNVIYRMGARHLMIPASQVNAIREWVRSGKDARFFPTFRIVPQVARFIERNVHEGVVSVGVI